MTSNEPPPQDPYNSTSGLPSYGSVPPPPEGGYPPPPPGAGMPAPGNYGMPPQQNKKAMWSMILGIISPLCCGIILGPVAIILSRQAKTEISYSRGQQTGEGMATAGLVLGIIGTIVWTLMTIARIATYA
ncbi:DUF4190 domain-containing protein [Aeromicrobium panaciterrae]|uniref:DUF4190 domain-containing protein n=1 Tax=Aeromicrobium panaciterrae TaxID=363861 RepID=UPI0031D7429D